MIWTLDILDNIVFYYDNFEDIFVLFNFIRVNKICYIYNQNFYNLLKKIKNCYDFTNISKKYIHNKIIFNYLIYINKFVYYNNFINDLDEYNINIVSQQIFNNYNINNKLIIYIKDSKFKKIINKYNYLHIKIISYFCNKDIIKYFYENMYDELLDIIIILYGIFIDDLKYFNLLYNLHNIRTINVLSKTTILTTIIIYNNNDYFMKLIKYT